jgi:phospholipid/cholesterol/gamma-HCH transport system substrate-binding protein
VTELTREVALDEQVLRRFVSDTATTVSALAERRDDLAGLVSNTNAAFRAIGDQSAALDRTLELLPSTLRKANTTFVNLRSALDDLDKLVAASKPATRDLAPFLRELRPLVAEARPTVADLRRLIRAPGAGNDLIELTAKQPRLARLTGSVFPRAIRTLDRAQPVFEYARGYTPDLASWLANFGQLAASYDASGHYARVQPMFLPANYEGGGLTAVPPVEKLDGFEQGILSRCPGGSVQPPPDGSAPLPVGGCDTSTTPPGP